MYMKAILNVSTSNQYSKFNGLTFEIKELMSSSVGLKGLDKNFPNNQTDFSFKEVMIVDIEIHYLCLQSQLETVVYGIEEVKRDIRNLNSYLQIKKIQF